MAPPPISRPRKSRARKKVEEEDVPQFPEFDIPYFAHQQLDPSKYSLSMLHFPNLKNITHPSRKYLISDCD